MRVDTVVFDVDGVLVDVADSYRRAVVETAERLHGETVPKPALQALKDAGGFNNDWELTDAVCLYVLARRAGYDADVQGYADAIAERGGGLEGARSALRDALGEAAVDRVEPGWNPQRVRTTFQQLYLGSEGYREIEGEEPELDARGYLHDEPVLVDLETLEWVLARFEVGVLTGRPATEAAIALDRVGLALAEEHVITMDSPVTGKPAPDGLLALADRLDATALAFVGDTLDDVRAAVRAAEADPGRTYAGIGVLTGGLTGEAGRAAYRSVGAATVLGSVNDLPDLLEPLD